MRSLIGMLSIAWMLAGCASGVPPRVEMPPRLPPPHLVTLTPFPPTLPEPVSAKPSDLLTSYVDAARLYHQMRARFQSLAEWALVPQQPASPPGPGDHKEK